MDSTSNVVVFRIGSIGDTVVALPCFHAIARTFSRQRRILLTNTVDTTRQSSVESLLQGTGNLDFILYDKYSFLLCAPVGASSKHVLLRKK